MTSDYVAIAYTSRDGVLQILPSIFQDEETHLLEEVGHLEEVMESLCKLTANPERLPSASEQVIEDAKIGYNLMSESIYGYHVSTSRVWHLERVRERHGEASTRSFLTFALESLVFAVDHSSVHDTYDASYDTYDVVVLRCRAHRVHLAAL